MALIVELPIRQLRFTQAKINSNFDEHGLWSGHSIYTLAAMSRMNKAIISLNVFRKIPVMDSWPTNYYKNSQGIYYIGSFINLEDFKTYSLNNRSLAAAVLAGLDMVSVCYAETVDILQYSYEFDTMDKGQSIYVRDTKEVITIPL